VGARARRAGYGRRTKFGLALEGSAKRILAHAKGEAKLPARRILLPDEVDVKRIRSQAGMSRAELARAFCISPRTLEEWRGLKADAPLASLDECEKPASRSRRLPVRGVAPG